MSWNVLADAYVRAEYYPGVDATLLRPGARTDEIAALVEASDADVVCLQEVEPPVLQALSRWDAREARKRGKPDSCMIAARRRVTIDEVRVIAFADGAPDREDSGHVAAIATATIGGGAVVRIACTHLRWDRAATPSSERWAVRQARQLIEALDPIDALPTIVCGDLNVTPHDEVHAMLRAAGLVDSCVDAPTACSNGRARRIDHVLHTPDLRATAIAPIALVDASLLPSLELPSDHAPVVVWFE
jgi:endonuclease/exonuclease/phosphatase family metal-dependent hydrolase